MARNWTSPSIWNPTEGRLWFYTCTVILRAGSKPWDLFATSLKGFPSQPSISWAVEKTKKNRPLVWATGKPSKLTLSSIIWNSRVSGSSSGDAAWEPPQPSSMAKLSSSWLTLRLNPSRVCASRWPRSTRPRSCPTAWSHASSPACSLNSKKMWIRKPITMSNNLMSVRPLRTCTQKR